MRPRPRFRLVLGTAVVLLLVGVGGWVGWAWRHPDAFRPYGGSADALDPAPVGRTTYFGLMGAEEVTTRVVLTEASPRISLNTADATVEVLICDRRAGAPAGGVGLQDEQMTHGVCDLGAVAGVSLVPGGYPARGVVVAVTPHRAGRVVVRGIDVRYDAGWRRGSQHIGLDAVLRAR